MQFIALLLLLIVLFTSMFNFNFNFYFYFYLELRTSCIPCEGGKFQSDFSSLICKQCPNGYYQTEHGSKSCRRCANNKYKTVVKGLGLDTQCGCDPGRYSTALGAARGLELCKACPAGYSQENIGNWNRSCGIIML